MAKLDNSPEISKTSLLAKLGQVLKAAGINLVEKTLWLYYASERPDTPAWAKAAIYGAIAYVILPTDLQPDVLPIIGYNDDLGVVLAALATVTQFVDDGVKQKASQTLESLNLSRS